MKQFLINAIQLLFVFVFAIIVEHLHLSMFFPLLGAFVFGTIIGTLIGRRSRRRCCFNRTDEP